MRLDAKTVAYLYAHIRDEWRELEEEAERAELALDCERQEEIANKLSIVRANIRKVRAELDKYKYKEESE